MFKLRSQQPLFYFECYLFSLCKILAGFFLIVFVELTFLRILEFHDLLLSRLKKFES